MKTFSPVQELASLQWELNNCRKTVLHLEDSIRETEQQLAADDPRTRQFDNLLQKVTEKDQQLKIIEDMLMRQKVVVNPTNGASTTLLRQAIDLRMHTHKQELRETKEDYYRLIQNLKVA
jgi:hypothetical protein